LGGLKHLVCDRKKSCALTIPDAASNLADARSWQPQPSAPNNRDTMSLARVLTLKGALTGKAITIRHP
jgi:hypothetical protein